MEEKKEKRVEEEQKRQKNMEENNRKGRENEAVVSANHLEGPPQGNGESELRVGFPKASLRGDSTGEGATGL